MATGYIHLPSWAGVSPDGSGTGNNPATPEIIVSSGTQATNSPKATFVHLLFDPTTDEHHEWQFSLPGNYASGGTLRSFWLSKSASTNVFRMKAAAAIGIVGTTVMDTIIFDTVVGVDVTPSATEGIATMVTLALTMTNAAASRPIIVMAGRDPDHANDVNANDARLFDTWFEYVTT